MTYAKKEKKNLLWGSVSQSVVPRSPVWESPGAFVWKANSWGLSRTSESEFLEIEPRNLDLKQAFHVQTSLKNSVIGP